MEPNLIRTLCQFCHTNCGIITRTDAEEIVSVAGDPDHPMNRGRCCAKSAAIPEIVSSKHRLRYPLKKTSSGLKRISWDEALDFAAENLTRIRDKFGPHSLSRSAGAPVSYQGRDGFREFMGVYGSPNFTGAANLCMAPRMTAFESVCGERRSEPDYDQARLVIFWGVNPLASERCSSYAALNGVRQVIPRLKERGVKIIAVDTYRTKTVREVNEWVRLNPGTDTALALAMMHVIIRDNLYDRAFVEAYTTGFEALADEVRSLDPKWAEAITGVTAERIESLAKEYAGAKPAVIYEGNGLDMYANGVDATRAVAMLVGLTGNFDAPGGNVFMPFAPQSLLPTKPAPQSKRIGYERFPIFSEVPFPAFKDALLSDDEGRPRAMISHHSNPALIQANEKRTKEALSRLDFLLVSDIFPTATAEMADLVLPVTSDFESYGYRAYSSLQGGIIALARPVVPPVGESRSVFEVEYALAERMGLHQDYPFRDEKSWIDFMLKPCGVSFEQLDREQIVTATQPVKYQKYVDHGFRTPSGRLEFYSETYKSKGQNPIPVYTEPLGEPVDHSALADQGFSLMASSTRPALFVHTTLKHTEALSKSYPEPILRLHPNDALHRGIEDGDVVEAFSAQGSIALTAELTEDTNPGLVWIDFGWGNPTDGKANINVLSPDEPCDPISGGTSNRLFPCEVRKAS